nr:uncharacterized protein LOC110791381 [Spinacia oleracea]
MTFSSLFSSPMSLPWKLGIVVDLFHDNQTTRAVQLENQVSQVHLDDFPNVTKYCQRIKMMADQLGNGSAPVYDQCKVLQLVPGLNEAYGGVATLIQHNNPLVPFSKAMSMLVLVESDLGKCDARDVGAALTR